MELLPLLQCEKQNLDLCVWKLAEDSVPALLSAGALQSLISDVKALAQLWSSSKYKAECCKCFYRGFIYMKSFPMYNASFLGHFRSCLLKAKEPSSPQ